MPRLKDCYAGAVAIKAMDAHHGSNRVLKSTIAEGRDWGQAGRDAADELSLSLSCRRQILPRFHSSLVRLNNADEHRPLDTSA
jgi:hypothetical protein